MFKKILLNLTLIAAFTSIVSAAPPIVINTIPFTITAPGAYTLAADLDGTHTSGAITFGADNIIFDLAGHTINSGSNPIMFASGKNCVIKNGTINASIPIAVNSGPTGTLITNLTLIATGIVCVYDAGTDTTIKKCTIEAPETGVSAFGNGITISYCAFHSTGLAFTFGVGAIVLHPPLENSFVSNNTSF